MTLPLKLQVDWEAHLEALPLATWIVGFNGELSLPQNQDIIGHSGPCGPIFLNHACREALGLNQAPDVDGAWTRYLHPEDRQACLVAWNDFLQGRSADFRQVVRWIRPDDKRTVTLSVRAQRLLCGDIQGWLRSAAAEQALARLEELTHARP